ncbi:MAG: TauD/TfdA family dioxygenase [Proteobacteria bacterium]|nr:TauD/TfdA family dioxygenase [Pseudomonadota bacterium]
MNVDMSILNYDRKVHGELDLDEGQSLYRVEELKPFGVKISAAVPNVDVRNVCSNLLSALTSRYKLVVLRHFTELSRDEFLIHSSKMIQGHREQIEWSFGPVMELKREAEARNYLFSSERVPFHWDGAFHKVPSFLLFHCLEAPRAEGGETLFCSGVGLYEHLTRDEINRWRGAVLTYRTEKAAHYGGEFSTPLFVRHERLGDWTVRYAEPVETDLNPVSLEISGLPNQEIEKLKRVIGQRLYDPANVYIHKWEDGDYLLADNLALLHGRHGFREDSPRHIRRIQLR